MIVCLDVGRPRAGGLRRELRVDTAARPPLRENNRYHKEDAPLATPLPRQAMVRGFVMPFLLMYRIMPTIFLATGQGLPPPGPRAPAARGHAGLLAPVAARGAQGPARRRPGGHPGQPRCV